MLKDYLAASLRTVQERNMALTAQVASLTESVSHLEEVRLRSKGRKETQRKNSDCSNTQINWYCHLFAFPRRCGRKRCGSPD